MEFIKQIFSFMLQNTVKYEIFLIFLLRFRIFGLCTYSNMLAQKLIWNAVIVLYIKVPIVAILNAICTDTRMLRVLYFVSAVWLLNPIAIILIMQWGSR